MKITSIYCPLSEMCKTPIAILLANALGIAERKTALIDADTENQEKTASLSIMNRPHLKKPFTFYDTKTWDNDIGKNYDHVLIDTSRSPTNGVRDVVKKNSDLVLIPCMLTEKSWVEGAKPAIEEMRKTETPFAVIVNHYVEGDANRLYDRLKALSAPIIFELPRLPALPVIVDSGMLPQYHSQTERAQWIKVLREFDSMAEEVTKWPAN